MSPLLLLLLSLLWATSSSLRLLSLRTLCNSPSPLLP